mmetsp:Transcript_14741/g.51665  ORF Transcript_14741/g.51665 Transcript_14741/m.51665 type:complete len:354 (-) Transcript_14741:1123-2184(-)
MSATTPSLLSSNTGHHAPVVHQIIRIDLIFVEDTELSEGPSASFPIAQDRMAIARQASLLAYPSVRLYLRTVKQFAQSGAAQEHGEQPRSRVWAAILVRPRPSSTPYSWANRCSFSCPQVEADAASTPSAQRIAYRASLRAIFGQVDATAVQGPRRRASQIQAEVVRGDALSSDGLGSMEEPSLVRECFQRRTRQLVGDQVPHCEYAIRGVIVFRWGKQQELGLRERIRCKDLPMGLGTRWYLHPEVLACSERLRLRERLLGLGAGEAEVAGQCPARSGVDHALVDVLLDVLTANQVVLPLRLVLYLADLDHLQSQRHAPGAVPGLHPPHRPVEHQLHQSLHRVVRGKVHLVK